MEPCDLSALEARFLIGAKQLSPVELLRSCLNRIEAVNGALNGVVAIDRERAEREAARAEADVQQGLPLGPLHGLPVGIKDLVDTAGLRTTYGSPLFATHVPERDEAVVTTLRRAGAVVCMKTNTPEWGAGGNTFNPVYGVSGNPFEPDLTCGGSSGGSAIALATGMMPLAHGSDNAGSLRIPASYCGVVGMRPTAGLVPSDRRPIGLSHLSVQGPMARTVEDTALLLSAMATMNPEDPLSGPFDAALLARPEPTDLSRLRLAFSADLGGFAFVDAELESVFRERLEALAPAFAAATEASPDFAGAAEVYEILRGVTYVGMYAKRNREQPDKWGRLVGDNLAAGARFTIEDIGEAHMQWTRLYRAAQGFFREFDLLITPTTAVRPWPKHDIYPATVAGRRTENYFDWVRLTYAITLLNHPCISIPCGRDRRGLPFGLQIVAPRHKDAALLQAALAIERILAQDPATARPVPDIAQLATRKAEDPLARAVA